MGPLTMTIGVAVLGGAAWQLYRMKGQEMSDWLRDRAARLRRRSDGKSAPDLGTSAPGLDIAKPSAGEAAGVPTPAEDSGQAVVLMPEVKTETPSAPESLNTIKGIGPTYARRLNAAGLVTYADLAASTVEQVRAIVAPDGQVVPHIESWITQADQLAAQRQ